MIRKSALFCYFDKNAIIKTILFLSVFVYGQFLAFGQQNLIPNPGFEENTGCPGSNVGLKNTVHWRKIDNHSGTPDYYYGDCYYNGILNEMAPGNLPFEGSGYAGQFVYYSHLNQAEYIQIKLTEALMRDSIYYLEFYVLPSSRYPHMIESYGVNFSIDPPQGKDPKKFKIIPLRANVQNPKDSFINDTINWTKISGTFKASGGEEFATFGNFKHDYEQETVLMLGNISQPLAGYMFLDGVGLKLASDTIAFKWETNEQPTEDVVNINDSVFEPGDLIESNDFDYRELIAVDTFHVQKNPVKIALWDHLKFDHDTVTVLLDDKIILENFALKKRKKKMKIEVHPGAHHLKIVVVNLGDVPPNTVSLKVKDGKHEKIVVLNSDLGKTESVVLKAN